MAVEWRDNCGRNAREIYSQDELCDKPNARTYDLRVVITRPASGYAFRGALTHRAETWLGW